MLVEIEVESRPCFLPVFMQVLRFKPARAVLPSVTGNESEHGVAFKLSCLLLKKIVIYFVVATVTRLWCEF